MPRRSARLDAILCRRSRRIVRQNAIRRQQLLADHLRDVETRRNQENLPRRSLCLSAQGHPNYRFILFGEEVYYDPYYDRDIPIFGYRAVLRQATAATGPNPPPPQGAAEGDSTQGDDEVVPDEEGTQVDYADVASVASTNDGSGSGDTRQGDHSAASLGPAQVSPSSHLPSDGTSVSLVTITVYPSDWI